jgi:hypothetical protein
LLEWDVIDRKIGGEHPVDVIALSLASEFAALAAIESPHSIRSLTMISPTDLEAAPCRLRNLAAKDSRRRSGARPFTIC